MAVTNSIIHIEEFTLTAGNTDIVYTVSGTLPNALIGVYCDLYGVYPTDCKRENNSIHITYEPQSTTMHVALFFLLNDMIIENNLLSDSETSALSAAQGKALKALIDNIHVTASLSDLTDVEVENLQTDDILIYDAIEEKWINTSLPSIPESINDLSDVVMNSPSNGQVLTFNNGEWINANPASSGISYSTSEQNTGIKWTDGKDIFQKSYEYTSISGGDNIFSFDLPSDALVIDQKNTFISTSEKMYWSDNNVSGNSINLVNTNYQRTVINIASVLAPYLSKATITVKYTKGN